MSAKTIGEAHSNTTHRIWGSAPGWAYCNTWIQSGEDLPEGTPIDCPACAASAARENA